MPGADFARLLIRATKRHCSPGVLCRVVLPL
jgi:hypothetical protein